MEGIAIIALGHQASDLLVIHAYFLPLLGDQGPKFPFIEEELELGGPGDGSFLFLTTFFGCAASNAVGVNQDCVVEGFDFMGGGFGFNLFSESVGSFDYVVVGKTFQDKVMILLAAPGVLDQEPRGVDAIDVGRMYPKITSNGMSAHSCL